MSTLDTKGEKEKNMKNITNAKGRTVIASDFEICPIDPLEFKYQPIPKCYGKIIVDTEVKTITFKHTGGTAPGIYQVLAAMFINKRWTKIMKDPANKNAILDGFLLFSYNGNICYSAHRGENGLPVIDKKLKYRRFFIDELTLNMSEFYHLLEDETLLTYFFSSRKSHIRKIVKEFSFKYLSPQEAQIHFESIEKSEEAEGDDWGMEEYEIDQFRIWDKVFGYEDFSYDSDESDFSDDFDFED